MTACLAKKKMPAMMSAYYRISEMGRSEIVRFYDDNLVSFYIEYTYWQFANDGQVCRKID